jgi:alpha-galactosidase
MSTGSIAAMLRACIVLLVIFALCVNSLEDGLANTPPMGYRTWNSYNRNVNQTLMHDIAKFLTRQLDVHITGTTTTPSAVTQATTLRDLGYVHVGLDDNWQACKAGVNGTFHDATGLPLINKKRFPDMKKMNDYIHSMGLKSGWCE